MKLILLIDDDEGIRFSFGETLRSRGHRVIEADSGKTGLELARQQMPDLILTDINMPGGGRPDATPTYQGRSPNSGVPKWS